MGQLIKRLGSGIGFVSEAIHDSRSRSSNKSSNTNLTPSSTRELSTQESGDNTAAPHYGQEAPDTLSAELDTGLSKSIDEKLTLNEDTEEEDRYLERDQDEAIWQLDETAQEVAPPTYSEVESTPVADESEETKEKKEEAMVRAILQLADPINPSARIPYPVIIPQRRPGNKDRGFVHAYAPVLAECGIGQDAFLGFLDSFYKASKASPWIEVVYFAASITGWVPELTVSLTSLAVQIAVGTAREIQTRHRRNNFLDRVNQDLFMPRGLFAMIMAFKDKVPGEQTGPFSKLSKAMGGQTVVSKQRLDLNQAAAKWSNADPAETRTTRLRRNLRLTSGATHGEIELPEAAPLVYPDLDRAALRAIEGKDPESEGTRTKLKSAGSWVADYIDRKAQAEYEADHPGSALAVPASQRKQFNSRYNDPNHPAMNGSLISLVTGGKVGGQPKKSLFEKVGDGWNAMRESSNKDATAGTTDQKEGGKPAPPRRRKSGLLGKKLQPDVLYLIIVNLPTEEEMKESLEGLDRAVKQVEQAHA